MASRRSCRVPLSCDVHVLHDAPLDIIDIIYLSYCSSPPIKAGRQLWETNSWLEPSLAPVHSQSKVKASTTQLLEWFETSSTIDYTVTLPPRVLPLHHWIDKRWSWTQMNTIIWIWYVLFGPYECTFHQFLFINVAHTLCTLRRHSAQATPLENFGSRTGEGLSMQIRRHYPKSFWTLVIQMETWPDVAHIPPRIW